VFTVDNTCPSSKEDTERQLALTNLHDMDTVVHVTYLWEDMYCCVFFAKACLVMLISTYPALEFR